MTLVVEDNVRELNMFRKCRKKDWILFSGTDGLMKFITVNSDNISTVVLDENVDPVKIKNLANIIKKMFPHISIIDYCDHVDKHTSDVFEHIISKPFDNDDAILLETISGNCA
jgi:hypothetical protein